MNASKSSRCVFCASSAPKFLPIRSRRRQFHSTPVEQATRKPAYPNIKAVDLGLIESRLKSAAKKLKPYTPREKQLLALKYTPEQLRAIEAGEAAIDPKDIVAQGRGRADPMSIDYLDDYSRIQPVIDKPVRAPYEDIDPDIKPLSEEETKARFMRWADNLQQSEEEFDGRHMKYSSPEEEMKDLQQKGIETGIGADDGLTPAQRNERLRKFAEYGEGPDQQASFERFLANPNNFFHSPKGRLDSQADALAPTLPKMEFPGLEYKNEDLDPNKERLLKQTGLSDEVFRRFRIKTLVCHPVMNQTRLGKIRSIYYLTIAGNQDGMLGIGEGKAAEFEDARQQSVMAAVRHMKPIPRYEGRTIYGDVEAKVSASVVQLSARPPGFGNRAQSLIFEMARAAGISDLSARCIRSRNPMNVIKATFEALTNQRIPEDVARARGRKLVDVRKVYYEGLVH